MSLFKIGDEVVFFDDVGIITSIDNTNPSNPRYIVTSEDTGKQSVEEKFLVPYVAVKN